MIKVTVFKKNGRYTGFICKGHADYADYGSDIVCSAVSALTINAVNSLEKLTKAGPVVTQDEESGYLEVQLADPSDQRAQLLMKSLILGIGEIKKMYGTKFIRTKVV